MTEIAPPGRTPDPGDKLTPRSLHVADETIERDKGAQSGKQRQEDIEGHARRRRRDPILVERARRSQRHRGSKAGGTGGAAETGSVAAARP